MQKMSLGRGSGDVLYLNQSLVRHTTFLTPPLRYLYLYLSIYVVFILFYYLTTLVTSSFADVDS